MARTKTTSKKQTNRKVVKGSGGLKSTNKLSWGKLALFALPIALIGGFFVYRSYAGSGFAFERFPDQMSYAYGNQYPNEKIDGVNYKFLVGESSINTLVSNADTSNSSKICASYKPISGTKPHTAAITHTIPGVKSISKEASYGTSPICISPILKGDSIVSIRMIGGDIKSKTGISKIYGSF